MCVHVRVPIDAVVVCKPVCMHACGGIKEKKDVQMLGR